MACDTNQIVAQGALKRFSTSQNRWVEQYYVLFRSSECNASRLDYYDNLQAYQFQPTVRKTVFVEEIVRVVRLQSSDPEIEERYGNGVKYMFKIEMDRAKDKPEVLSASTAQAADKWINSIHELVEHARMRNMENRRPIVPQISEAIYSPHQGQYITFEVEIDDTAASKMCELNGKYKMILTDNHVTLFDERNKESVLTWDYCNIRRYGYGSERLTLEGGRKAGRAAGLFLFKNCMGVKIISAFKEKMRLYQKDPVTTTGDEYTITSLGPVSPNQSQPQNKPPLNAVNGVSLSTTVVASTPPALPSSPPIPATAPAPAVKPKPKVAAKNLGLNQNGNASDTKISKISGSPSGSSVASGGSSNSGATKTPISPMANSHYVETVATETPPPSSSNFSARRMNSIDGSGYVGQKLPPSSSVTSSTSSLTDVRGHPTCRQLSLDASGRQGRGPSKMSEVLEKMHRMKTIGCDETTTGTATVSGSDTYERIELKTAGRSRLASTEILSRSIDASGTGDQAAWYDPSHLYGPIQPHGLPRASHKPAAAADSDYAEITLLH